MARPRKIADPAPATETEHAPPASGRIIATAIYIHIVSTAKLGGLDVFALHRIPLLRKKLSIDGEVKLLGEWPEGTSRRRQLDGAGLHDEYRRMRELFVYENSTEDGRRGDTVDLLSDFYGPPTSGRLVSVMRRMEQAWNELEKRLAQTGQKAPTEEDLEAILELAEPERDFDAIPYEPAEAG